MNPFTTDHPLTAQTSWFDRKEHPRLSFVCATFLLALILTPLWFVRLYIWFVNDIGAEPNPFTESWPTVFWTGFVASIGAIICAVPLVAAHRHCVGRWRG